MNAKQNKLVGIIGGVGPQATSVLYTNIIAQAQKKYKAANNDEYPHLLIESVPIPDFISDKNKINTAQEMLINTIDRFNKAGVSRVAIASNTVHLLLDELQTHSHVEFISMLDLVANKAAKSFSKVGVVASSMTLGTKLYEHKLRDRNIEVIKPDNAQMKIIDQIIRHVLAGSDNGKQKQQYIDTLQSLYDRGAEAVILGCTELPLAINYEALGDKVLNSMQILAEGIVDYYYS